MLVFGKVRKPVGIVVRVPVGPIGWWQNIIWRRIAGGGNVLFGESAPSDIRLRQGISLILLPIWKSATLPISIEALLVGFNKTIWGYVSVS